MVDRITGGLAKEAMIAALKDQMSSAQGVREDAAKMFQQALDPSASPDVGKVSSTKSVTPASILGDGLSKVNGNLRAAEPDQLAKDLITGEIDSIHEVAARINKAKLSFDFAMEVRNKLIEAYRETMRMGI
ncbi:MAG: flagellar hook-basal body complex protein FliE [Planctomycetota bacterium]|jgi:flagellar hook-basal body complex protein FliE